MYYFISVNLWKTKQKTLKYISEEIKPYTKQPVIKFMVEQRFELFYLFEALNTFYYMQYLEHSKCSLALADSL